MSSINSIFSDRKTLVNEISQADAPEWDLIIIGGGITGAAVLREAVRCGYRSLLIEQKDFAWGTSSRSSKMVHGGLRYLASGHFALTKDSLTERERLLSEAPDLVKRAGFYFIIRKGRFPGRWSMSIILKIYDYMAGVRDACYYASDKIQERFRGIRTKGLKGGWYYTDASTDDARLVLRLLQEASNHGGQMLNYVKAKNLIIHQDKVSGVTVENSVNGEVFDLRAKVVVNSTGVWADKLRNKVNAEQRIRPLRGSHLVIATSRLPIFDTLVIFHPVDNRGVFIYPWEGVVLVGTTDLDHSGDLDIEPSITNQELNYLLQAANFEFPDLALSRDDILSTWAGVRPVIGSDKSKDPSKERRDHAVWIDKGLVTVSGGKLTTFRTIALDALKAASEQLRPASTSNDDDRIFAKVSVQAEELLPENPERARRLIGRYGEKASELLVTAITDELALIDGTQYSFAECRWALKHEMVYHLDDLLLRRTRLGLVLPKGGEAVFSRLQDMFKQELGYSDEKWRNELQRYQEIWRSHYSLPDEKK
jgi:glycerol-3-phosphate dehydrogenase